MFMQINSLNYLKYKIVHVWLPYGPAGYQTKFADV